MSERMIILLIGWITGIWLILIIIYEYIIDRRNEKHE